jgi:hypothetical protein
VPGEPPEDQRRASGAARAARERRATLLAVALSDGRRQCAVLDDGAGRAFRTDLVTVSVPEPHPGMTARALTCALAIQSAPSKEAVAAVDWTALRGREREALAWVEGAAAVRWARERWPGLADDLRALFPWVPDGPAEPDAAELLRLSRACAREGRPGPAPPLLGALPLPRPVGAGSPVTRTRVATRWSKRQRALRRGLLQVPVSGPATEPVLEPGDPGTIDALDGRPEHALGLPYDEWDHGRRRYRRDHVRVLELATRPAPPGAAPARPLRLTLDPVQPLRSRRRHREHGDVDIDAVVRWRCDVAAERTAALTGLYAELAAVPGAPAWALLIDASASSSRSGGRLLRRALAASDALAEALCARGDHVGVFAFCSRTRERVEVRVLKEFDRPFTPLSRALRPGGYTRLGAAVRHTGRRLLETPATGHVLVSLGDALPYDEGYGERYGRADVAMAVRELRERGAVVRHASLAGHDAGSLDEMFGSRGWEAVTTAASLPALVHGAQAEIVRAA